MTLVLLIGGARSGKSDLAVRLAEEQTARVVLLATAEAGDAEMAGRIAQHQGDRSSSWETIEEPLGLCETIAAVSDDSCLIVDCLTLWTANALEQLGAAEAEAHAAAAAAAGAARSGLTMVVSNEVGLGIVPDNALARSYRDLLGRVNAIWSSAADHVFLVLAGRLLRLETPASLREMVR
jgi:adenosylcobinamide kinase / adenosylcobinamide-phosphate guanylyltransferase